VGLCEYKQSNLYSDFVQGGDRIMGVVFNDKFMPRARVVSRSDYARCQKSSRLFGLPGNASVIIHVLFVNTQKNVEMLIIMQEAASVCKGVLKKIFIFILT